ncbi:MAG: nodulation protein NfeD [Gemmatimonadetes bacterium]|nr:nodulation protein NfeD [Gemmatimonadota bacterium]
MSHYRMDRSMTQRTRYPLAVLLALCSLAPVPAWAQARVPAGAVYRVPVTGVIELGLAPFVERALREAAAAQAAAVVLDLDTPGGRIDAAERIVDAVQASAIPVYAFVNSRAFSAGALVSLAAREIYYVPAAVIGAATPVTGEGTKAPEKIVSAMRSEMRALAEARGRDPRVAEAMVDEDVAIPGVVEAGKLLTLTGQEAVRLGYGKEVAGWDALLQALDLQQAPVVTMHVNWAERLVRFFTHPAVAPLLLSLGFLGIIIELKAPGFGLPGALGAIALALFFGSHFLLGLAGLEELLLIGAGIILVGVEMFLLPGFGVAGVLGGLAIAGGFYLSFVSDMASGADYVQALGLFSLSVLVVILVAWALLRRLPRSRRFSASGIMLDQSTSREAGYLSAAVRPELIGTTGVAMTDLRPAGAARFGDERLDVVADANWINAGTRVRIVRSEGYRHVVEPVE